MAKAKAKSQRRGRPATIAATSVISIKMAPAMVVAVSEWASEAGVTRSEGARRLIELGLQAKSKGKRADK